jgi:hypothetical protein
LSIQVIPREVQTLPSPITASQTVIRQISNSNNVIDAFLGRKYFRRKRHTAREGEAAKRGEESSK